MHKLVKIGITLAVLYILIIILAYFFQEKLIFLPSKLSQQHVFEFRQPFVEFNLTTDDGAILNGVHVKNNSAKGVILFFHGNAGNMTDLTDDAILLTKNGYDVVFMDFRTYGKSTGELSEIALNGDAQLFYNHVLKEYDENNIVLYGRSLGSGIASRLAAKNNPRRLILESPYSSLVDVGNYKFPILPVSWFSKYKIPSIEYVQEVKCPITIIHGTADTVIPFKLAQKLYDAIPREDKKIYVIEGGGHNNLPDFDMFLASLNKALN